MAAADSEPVESSPGNFVPVAIPEELPKGYRKNVKVDGVDVLLLWYKNKIYAIEARSPAEGAYSEGFMNAKLNQDDCIACPSTGTLFSLKTGEIIDWYPNNGLLRAITPQRLCRNLDVFPVKLTRDAISVDVTGAATTTSSPAGRGGADTSIDMNNVFAEEGRPYLEGQDPETGEIDEDTLNKVNPYVIGVTFFGITFAGVAGSAFAIYKESYIGLAGLWIAILGVSVYSAYSFTPLGTMTNENR